MDKEYFFIKKGWAYRNDWCVHQGAFCTEIGEYLFYHFEGEQLPIDNWENYESISDLDLPKLAFPRAITRYLENIDG